MTNTKVIDILDEIENRSEFYFLFNQKLVDVERKVDMNVKNKTIDDILNDLFAKTNVYHQVKDRLIILTTEKPGSVDGLNTQQQKSVSGKVTDENGEPIPGVTIAIKGTTHGTITDMDGNFTIADLPEGSILQFSFVGMLTQKIVVGDQTSINVTMTVNAIGLEEVVSVGYGTQKRVNVSGAVATVGSKDLVKVSVANTTNAITGRLSGIITKQESGQPGSDNTSINIRGFGEPLIIVDGIQRSFYDINAEEIESISVLKDASAAIYGSRAGNGVLLVTTKRGVKGQIQFQYKNSFSFQGVTNFPNFVSSGQYTELYREAELNDGIAEDELSYSQEDIDNYYAEAPGYNNSDWWAATVKDWTPQQQHSLSITGGSEKIRFYGLLGFVDQRGMYKSGDNKMQRYNVRSNIDVDVAKNLTFSMDLSGKVQSLKAPNTGTNGVFTAIWSAFPFYPTSLPDATKVPFSGKAHQNPVAITTRDISGYHDANSDKVQGTFRLKYNMPFIKGLRAEGRFDYYGISDYNKTWENAYDLYTYDTETDVYAKAASQPQNGLNEDYTRSRILTGQFSLNYERTFNNNHSVKGLLLYEVIDSKGNNFWASRREFLTSSIQELFASGILNQDLSGSSWEDGRISYVGRLNYNFKGKYLFESSFRYDGSNRFPSNKRWGFFPSASAAWRISEEGFMQNEWLDNLKLRVSYSQSGKDDTGKFQFLTGYEFGNDYIINDQLVKGIISTGVANPNITWETMTTYNIGADFGAFNNKLFAEFDMFYRERDGILATRIVSLPNTVGASLPAENLNSQSNRGCEFSLGYQNRIGDFKYSVKGIASWARAKWEDFDEPDYTDEDDIRIRKKTGQWTNVTYGYNSLGFFQNQDEIDAWPVEQDLSGNSTLKPGDLKYQDLNDDGTLDWRDQDIIGKTGLPEFMYSFSTDLQYKRFDFSMLLQGAAGHSVEMDTRSIFGSSSPKPFEYMFTERWSEGVEDALYPRARTSGAQNNTRNSNFWLKPGRYLRLKSINIGYSLSPKIVKKAGIKNLRFFISGENLLTFSGLTKYGFDPESPKDQSGKTYPQMRTLSGGLNLTF